MKRSHFLLLLVAISFFMSGMFEHFVAPMHHRAQALVHGLVTSILCYMWCKAESRERAIHVPGRAALWAGIFPLVGLPVYFFRTRNKKAAFFATLKASGFLMMLAFLQVAAKRIAVNF